jgi:hypothetical protein
VPPQVVVPARRAHDASRRVRLQPPLALSPVPDPVLRPQHPPLPLAIQDCKVPHGNAKRPRLEDSGAALLDQVAITQLSFGEWIDSHRESIAPMSGLRPDAPLPACGRGRHRSRSDRWRVGAAGLATGWSKWLPAVECLRPRGPAECVAPLHEAHVPPTARAALHPRVPAQRAASAKPRPDPASRRARAARSPESS